MKTDETTRPFVVTIGRQFGSGGRVLGRLLAERLGIEFFDKELLLQAARKSGVIPQLYEHKDERMPSVLGGGISFTMGLIHSAPWTGQTSVSDESMQCAIADTIRDLAASRSCVIVGRTADYVLRDNHRCINVFVHAPEPECIKRVMQRGDCATEADARAMCRKINKLRAAYYNFYTDKRWGHSSSYHLTVDSSLMPMERLADFIAGYVKILTTEND